MFISVNILLTFLTWCDGWCCMLLSQIVCYIWNWEKTKFFEKQYKKVAFCNRADEAWEEQIQLQAFINVHSQNSKRAKQQQTVMAWARHKSNPRESVGLRSEKQYPKGSITWAQIQAGANRVQNDKTKERTKADYKLQGWQRSGNKRDTQARIKI